MLATRLHQLLLYAQSGGIDNYLLNTRHELLGQEGLRLRLAVRSGLAEKAQQAKATELAARAASGNDANTVSPEDRLATLKARKERRVLRENILKIEDGVAASTLSRDPRPTKQTAREQRIRVGKLLGFGEGVLARSVFRWDFISRLLRLIKYACANKVLRKPSITCKCNGRNDPMYHCMANRLFHSHVP